MLREVGVSKLRYFIEELARRGANVDDRIGRDIVVPFHGDEDTGVIVSDG